MQDEDSLSFLSSVLGALGSTLSNPGGPPGSSASTPTPTGNPQAIFVGLLIAAIAKTLPSLKDNYKKEDLKKSAEDWFLLACAIFSALAALMVNQPPYTGLAIYLLLVGILGKALIPIVFSFLPAPPKTERVKRKKEDFLTVFVAIIVLGVLLLLHFSPYAPTAAVFCAFLTKALTSSNSN
jgi:uncharacterized membrane protein HdeD (DUF308 family)